MLKLVHKKRYVWCYTMGKASRQVVFINTSPPDERVEVLKPLNDIRDMTDDCEEVFTSGLIKRYTNVQLV